MEKINTDYKRRTRKIWSKDAQTIPLTKKPFISYVAENLFYGTTRTYQLIKKHRFGKRGSNVEFSMCKTS